MKFMFLLIRKINRSFRTLTSCVALMLAVTPSSRAATFEIVPQIGYQFVGGRDLSRPYDHMDFRDDANGGLSVGYLTPDDGEIELSWIRLNSQITADKADRQGVEHFDVHMDQFQMDFMHMGHAGAWEPFVLIGLGAMHFHPEGNRGDNLKFSFALGGGAKWLWNDHFGLRFDGRLAPVFAPGGSSFFCKEDSSGCYTAESNTYLSHFFPMIPNYEFMAGLLLRL